MTGIVEVLYKPCEDNRKLEVIKVENPKEQELINLKDTLQELLEDGEDNQLLRDKIQELENELRIKRKCWK